MSPERRRRLQLRNLLFALYVICCAGALTWPGYDWLGNRIEPRWFGLPFSLTWIIGWVSLTFVVLVIYHASGEREGS